MRKRDLSDAKSFESETKVEFSSTCDSDPTGDCADSCSSCVSDSAASCGTCEGE